MSKTFNVATLPAELLAKQNSKWSALGALAEMIDNSFGELRGNAGAVAIFYDPHRRILSIVDDGQATDHIGYMFQFGNTIGSGGIDPGKYGVGGKHGMLWLSQKTEVWSLRDGKVMHDSVIWKDWFRAKSFDHIDVSDEWVRASLGNTPAELMSAKHGVMIRCHLLPRRKIDAAKLTRELAKLYSTGLRAGKKIEWNTVQKSEIVDTKILTDPFVPPSANAQIKSFDLVVEHENDDGDVLHLPVAGRVYYDEATTVADSKIQLGYGYRIIRSANECYRSPDGSEKFSGIGVSGWLDLGKEWRDLLTQHKDEIDDEMLFDKLMAYVFDEIRPLLIQAKRKMFDLQFEDLAVGLEKSLSSKSGDVIVNMGGEGRGPRGEEGYGDGESKGPYPELTHPKDEPGDRPKTVPPLLKINLIPASDEQMQQQLCRAEFTGTDVKIYINEDHQVIEEALIAKPINKMVLHQVVVDELANEIASAANSDKIISAMFKPATVKLINERDQDRDRARMMTRILIDRVHNGQTDEAAE